MTYERGDLDRLPRDPWTLRVSTLECGGDRIAPEWILVGSWGSLRSGGLSGSGLSATFAIT